MNRFFTSDLHFGHENIIKYCNRPYKNAAQMDLDIIIRWNATVDKNDTVYILGDFSLSKEHAFNIVKKLNGKKILILGNHDHPHQSNSGKTKQAHQTLVKQYIDNGFDEVYTELEIILLGPIKVLLSHIPYANIVGFEDTQKRPKLYKFAPMDNGKVLLCGHVHGAWRTQVTTNGTLMVNVGWDAWDRLLSEEEVVDIIERGHKKWDFGLICSKTTKKLSKLLKKI